MRASHCKIWLSVLADPQCSDVRELPQPLSAEELRSLLVMGEVHGVLPAVVGNMRKIAQNRDSGSIVAADAGKSGQAVLAEAFDDVQVKLRHSAALCLLLRQQAREITSALGDEGIPVTVIKGAECADRLYPHPSDRRFTDVDLLVSTAAFQAAEAVMGVLGYLPKDTSMKYDSGYGESCFVRRGQPGGVVEIHWNLVNSPTLRRGISVAYEDLQLDSDGRLTPASLLLIAAVHGAASHSFDRLQLLCDVCQAARGAAGQVDIDWLSAATRRTGSCLAVTAALDLAGRTFTAPECGQVLEQLKLPRQSGIWKLMMTPAMVLRAHATLDSPRRSIFRQMLKRSR